MSIDQDAIEQIDRGLRLYHEHRLKSEHGDLSDLPGEGIVRLSRIGLTDPQHAWFTTGLEPIILGVSPPSFHQLDSAASAPRDPARAAVERSETKAVRRWGLAGRRGAHDVRRRGEARSPRPSASSGP